MNKTIRFLIIAAVAFLTLFYTMVFQNNTTGQRTYSKTSTPSNKIQRELYVIMKPENYKKIELIDSSLLKRKELIQIQNANRMDAFVDIISDYKENIVNPSILKIESDLAKDNIDSMATIKDMEIATMDFLKKEYPTISFNSPEFHQLIKDIFSDDMYGMYSKADENSQLALAFFYMNLRRTDFFNNSNFEPSTTVRDLIEKKIIYDFHNEEIPDVIRKFIAKGTGTTA